MTCDALSGSDAGLSEKHVWSPYLPYAERQHFVPGMLSRRGTVDHQVFMSCNGLLTESRLAQQISKSGAGPSARRPRNPVLFLTVGTPTADASPSACGGLLNVRISPDSLQFAIDGPRDRFARLRTGVNEGVGYIFLAFYVYGAAKNYRLCSCFDKTVAVVYTVLQICAEVQQR